MHNSLIIIKDIIPAIFLQLLLYHLLLYSLNILFVKGIKRNVIKAWEIRYTNTDTLRSNRVTTIKTEIMHHKINSCIAFAANDSKNGKSNNFHMYLRFHISLSRNIPSKL